MSSCRPSFTSSPDFTAGRGISQHITALPGFATQHLDPARVITRLHLESLHATRSIAPRSTASSHATTYPAITHLGFTSHHYTSQQYPASLQSNTPQSVSTQPSNSPQSISNHSNSCHNPEFNPFQHTSDRPNVNPLPVFTT